MAYGVTPRSIQHVLPGTVVVGAQAQDKYILRLTVAMAAYSAMMGIDAQAGQWPDIAFQLRGGR